MRRSWLCRLGLLAAAVVIVGTGGCGAEGSEPKATRAPVTRSSTLDAASAAAGSGEQARLAATAPSSAPTATPRPTPTAIPTATPRPTPTATLEPTPEPPGAPSEADRSEVAQSRASLSRLCNILGSSYSSRGPQRHDVLRWSPDGSEIYFFRDGPLSAAIFAVAADGSHLRTVKEIRRSTTSFDMSPDGATLVYSTCENGSFDIARINVDGSQATWLTDSWRFEGPARLVAGWHAYRLPGPSGLVPTQG